MGIPLSERLQALFFVLRLKSCRFSLTVTWEVSVMDDLQIKQIDRLRQDGKGYRTIAAELGLPINSVKSWCRRHPLEAGNTDVCLHCGVEIISKPHKRKRKFCSDKCRLEWWSAHPDKRTARTVYPHICKFCGSEFKNGRINAEYCSRECFAKARTKVSCDG